MTSPPHSHTHTHTHISRYLPLLDAGGREAGGIEYAVPGLSRHRLAEAQIIDRRLGIGYARIDVHFATLHRYGTAAHRTGAGLHHQAIDDAAHAGQLRRQHEQRGEQRVQAQPRDHFADVNIQADAKDARDVQANEILRFAARVS